MPSPIRAVVQLGPPPWATSDPFLFCVHHLDNYPKGNGAFGPAASLAGRQMGQDFAGKDGWRMYHGQSVPGFPQHPHRGFETITLARRGLIDHSDSLGSKARFGHGDVQWMTAGAGVVHAEMFPLLNQEQDNPAELFQIWLNLPASDKMVPPHFKMLWAESIPKLSLVDEAGKAVKVTVIAGRHGDAAPPSPPPHSWAARPEAMVTIQAITLSPGARFAVPATDPNVVRTLYFFRGTTLTAHDRVVPVGSGIQIGPVAVTLENGPTESEVLLLGGRPIGEPVAQYGPFVMNTHAELEQTFADYRRTGFGGWPWDRNDPVHGSDGARFAVHADGKEERPA